MSHSQDSASPFDSEAEPVPWEAHTSEVLVSITAYLIQFNLYAGLVRVT